MVEKKSRQTWLKRMVEKTLEEDERTARRRK